MGNLMRGSMMVEGYIAGIVYISVPDAPGGPARLHQDRPHHHAGGPHQPVLRPSMKLH